MNEERLEIPETGRNSIFSRSSRRSENIVGSEGGGVGSSAKEEDKELGVGALDSIVVITR